MATNAANPDVSDEFWRDDAVALRQAEAIREEERRTGIRMPPPAASKPARRESGFRAEPEQSNERAAIWWVAVITAGIVVGSVVCAVVAYAAGWFVLTRHDVITLEEFERLETGMTVEQCNQIVGEQGVESFSANSFGQSDRVFAWQNSGGTVVTAAFTNNRLHSKIQLGLK